MVGNPSQKKFRAAIAVIRSNRGFNILKISNVLVLFFRSLSCTISATAHIIDVACSKMSEEDKLNWPFDRSVKVIDSAGAT